MKDSNGKTTKRNWWGCGCAAAAVLALFAMGVPFAMLSSPIQKALHDREAKRLFRAQFAVPGRYEAMPYGELAALIGSAFTEGDAVERFGWPDQMLRGGCDSWLDWFHYWVPWPLGTGEEREMVTGFTLVFQTNYVLQEWFPTAISGVKIREEWGTLTETGAGLGASERWPGRAPEGWEGVGGR